MKKPLIIIGMLSISCILIYGCSNKNTSETIYEEEMDVRTLINETYFYDDLDLFIEETLAMIWNADPAAAERMVGADTKLVTDDMVDLSACGYGGSKEFYQQLLNEPDHSWAELAEYNEVLITESNWLERYSPKQQMIETVNHLPTAILSSRSLEGDHNQTVETILLAVVFDQDYQMKLFMDDQQFNKLVGHDLADTPAEFTTILEETALPEYLMEISRLTNSGNAMEALEVYQEYLSSNSLNILEDYSETMDRYYELSEEDQDRIRTILAETTRIDCGYVNDSEAAICRYTAYEPVEYWMERFMELVKNDPDSPNNNISLPEGVLLFHRYIPLKYQQKSHEVLFDEQQLDLSYLYHSLSTLVGD